MLKNVRIENFRCLRDVDVPLRPLTVLLGPNDTGKSAFLHALRFLAEMTSLSLSDWWRLEQSTAVSVLGKTENQLMEVRSQGHSAHPPGVPNPLRPTECYQLPSAGVRLESPGVSDEGGAPAITHDGGMIPALLDYLYRTALDRFWEFNEVMRGLIPGLERVEVRTPQAGNRRIDLIKDHGLRIQADNNSAGVRLLIFFVALAYHPTPPKLILVEEPENGIHPKLLGHVIRLLREIAEGAHAEHAAQVVVSTHSPHLLDFVDVNKDQVLVFRRNKDGSRSAEPADEDRLKNFLDEFMLGEVWFNEEEPGLVERKT